MSNRRVWNDATASEGGYPLPGKKSALYEGASGHPGTSANPVIRETRARIATALVRPMYAADIGMFGFRTGDGDCSLFHYKSAFHDAMDCDRW